MTIPKYVKDMMCRAEYNYDNNSNPNYCVGYTVDIKKASHYQKIDTFKKEIDRLISWAKREYKKLGDTNECCEVACVLRMPTKTTYIGDIQSATVTIYDPIMKIIEQYIMEG